MLTLTSNNFPADLLNLPQPPKILRVLGADLNDLMRRPRLAVVGSRKMTAYGRAVTRKIVTELVNKGVVIVSGLAIGVDGEAHRACLDAGGETIAVLPSGLNQVYPAIHSQLAEDIVKAGGTLVTEYEDGTVPYAVNFLARNRIIAGLSDAVLVIEAAERSGTLNTVNHALDLGKTILAVPGDITRLSSVGCNNLIKVGAMPVTCVDDILKALNWQTTQAVLALN